MSASTSRRPPSMPPAKAKRALFRGALAVRCVALLATSAAAAFLLPSLASGCVQQPTIVPVRSLEQSGRVSFVCLDKPDVTKEEVASAKSRLPHVPKPIEACSAARVLEVSDYVVDAGDVDGGASIPHLYALVTQTTRGEVAVIDTTATHNPVLDQDPSVPGANFLPVGAQPVDIVSTDDGKASFVGVAEVGREAIFALRSDRILPRTTEPDAGLNLPDPALEISSWPVCRLPSAPGQMLLLRDPAGEGGALRESCDSPPEADPGADCDALPFDLSRDDQCRRIGRQKLVVAMPEEGGIAVFDAQSLLDITPDEAFGPCKIERWLPLKTDVPSVTLPDLPTGLACTNPAPETPAIKPGTTSRPSGISYAAGRLYVSDLEAPVIHVIDMATPCEPVELAPLLPLSMVDPSRVVTTKRVAVSPSLTPDLKRYLYAVDAEEGSAMVFDVSDGAASRLPLSHPHPEWNPFALPDRIHFDAPIADLVLLQRDVALSFPPTGAVPEGARCDPDPSLTVCTPQSQACDIGTVYRTAADYKSGAGPLKLRGVFAFLALTNGKVAVVDIDDYDAPCRRPNRTSLLSGCERQCTIDSECPEGRLCGAGLCLLKSSGDAPVITGEPCSPGGTCAGGLACAEGLCHVPCQSQQTCVDLNNGTACVGGFCLPPDQRSCPAPSTCTDLSPSGALSDQQKLCDACTEVLASSGELSCNVVLPNAPRMGAYDVGAAVAGQREPGIQNFPLLYNVDGALIDTSGAPRMVATLPAQGGAIDLSVADQVVPIDSQGSIQQVDGTKNALAVNIEDPRAQAFTQDWAVTFEGALPGGEKNVGAFQPAVSAGESEPVGTINASDGRFCGAGVESERELLDRHLAADDATRFADYVQIASAYAFETDAYWNLKHVKDPCDDSASAASACCSFNACRDAFGDVETPLTGRDLLITEAFEDHLEVTARDLAIALVTLQSQLSKLESELGDLKSGSASTEQIKAKQDEIDAKQAEIKANGQKNKARQDLAHCCFPTEVQFNLRGGNQWIVTGSGVGFLHHVIADPMTGACRDSCEPRKERLNGRVLEVPARGDGQAVVIPDRDKAHPKDTDKFAFINPMFRFAVIQGSAPSSRDFQFRFTTQGAFTPLLISLSSDPAILIQPVGMAVVPIAARGLAVTDGSINGLTVISLSSVVVTQQFF